MGVKERKKKERDELKNKIRSTAIALFIDRGVESVTIRKIAEKIEYAPATIYLYYKDKTEILMDLHKEGFTILIGYMQGISLKPGETTISILKKMAKAYLSFAIDNPEYYALIFVMSYKQKGLKSPDEWIEGRMAYDSLRGVVAKCIEEGHIKSSDTEAVTFTNWSFVHGLASLLVSQAGGPVAIDNPKEFAVNAIDFFYSNYE